MKIDESTKRQRENFIEVERHRFEAAERERLAME